MRTPTVDDRWYRASCGASSDGDLFDAQWQTLEREWRTSSWHWYQHVGIANGARNPARSGVIPSPTTSWHQVHMCNQDHNRPIRLRLSGSGWSWSSNPVDPGERLVVTIDSSYPIAINASWDTTAMWFADTTIRVGHIGMEAPR